MQVTLFHIHHASRATLFFLPSRTFTSPLECRHQSYLRLKHKITHTYTHAHVCPRTSSSVTYSMYPPPPPHIAVTHSGIHRPTLLVIYKAYISYVVHTYLALTNRRSPTRVTRKSRFGGPARRGGGPVVPCAQPDRTQNQARLGSEKAVSGWVGSG